MSTPDVPRDRDYDREYFLLQGFDTKVTTCVPLGEQNCIIAADDGHGNLLLARYGTSGYHDFMCLPFHVLPKPSPVMDPSERGERRGNLHDIGGRLGALAGYRCVDCEKQIISSIPVERCESCLHAAAALTDTARGNYDCDHPGITYCGGCAVKIDGRGMLEDLRAAGWEVVRAS